MSKLDKRSRGKGGALKLGQIILAPSRRHFKKKLTTCACDNSTYNPDSVCAVCRVFQRVRSNMPPEILDAFGMRPRIDIYGGMSS